MLKSIAASIIPILSIPNAFHKRSLFQLVNSNTETSKFMQDKSRNQKRGNI